MYMIMFVLDDPNRLDAVLEAWHTIGVSGVTIVESTGIYRQRVPARYGLGGLAVSREEGHYTLFVIVPDEELVRKSLAAVEEVVGNLDDPNTGVLAAWPIMVVKGVPGRATGLEESR